MFVIFLRKQGLDTYLSLYHRSVLRKIDPTGRLIPCIFISTYIFFMLLAFRLLVLLGLCIICLSLEITELTLWI
jgi:hypothetical protein